MVIYDKNQFAFNLVFIIILCCSLAANYLYFMNMKQISSDILSLNATLGKVEENQNFNFIQGGHAQIEYQLTPQGFYVNANDFGKLSGPSMQPSIFDGNILIENKYDGKINLTAGQIVRFTREDGTGVIHRVRADYGNRVYVQGDSLKDGEIISKDKITHVIVGVLFS